MIEVMVDIEAAGHAPSGAVLSIGAVRWWSVKGAASEEREEFYANVELRGQGRVLDEDTVAWWLTQPEALPSLQDPRPVPLADALDELVGFLKGVDYVWANGASFDFEILRDAYVKLGRRCPWRRNQELCLRPIRQLGDLVGQPYRAWKAAAASGGARLHDALEDARLQASYLAAVRERIGLG